MTQNPGILAPGDLADATIVFDLDGTLVDTAPDLVRALNLVMDHEDMPRIPVETVRHLVGHGARRLIERGAQHNGVRFTDTRLDELTAAFIEFYRADIASASKPFANCEAALDILARAGARLAVCTNKRTDLSVQLLEALNMAERFSAIVGADAVVNRKPHPDHYRETVSRAGGELRRSLMVGDSTSDVGAAKAAGRPVIVASFGYLDLPIEQLEADRVMNGYEDLAALVREILVR